MILIFNSQNLVTFCQICIVSKSYLKFDIMEMMARRSKRMKNASPLYIIIVFNIFKLYSVNRPTNLRCSNLLSVNVIINC